MNEEKPITEIYEKFSNTEFSVLYKNISRISGQSVLSGALLLGNSGNELDTEQSTEAVSIKQVNSVVYLAVEPKKKSIIE